MPDVPIWLIHQKAYNTGRRLPTFVPLPPKRVVSAVAAITVPENKPGVTIAEATEQLLKLRALFAEQPFLYRWFWMGHAKECFVFCRGCSLQVRAASARELHRPCQSLVQKVLDTFVERRVCIVCKEELKVINKPGFYNTPICSTDCWELWCSGMSNPGRVVREHILTEAPHFRQMLDNVRMKINQDFNARFSR